MLDEIDLDPVFDPTILDEIVEGGAAREVLEPVYDREAAVVADHDDQLVAGQDRGIDVRVHHQIGAVAGEDDHVALRIGHLGPPAAGDFVAHAGEAELAVEGADGLGLPVLAQLARQAAGGGQRQVGRIADPADGPDHVRVAGPLDVGRPRVGRHRLVPGGVH